MTPFPADNLAWILSSGLLIADFVYSSGADQISLEDMGPVLHGDLLLVTHAVGSCLDQLHRLRLGQGDVLLHEIWPVDSFSRYQSVRGSKPRVFVANAGWVTEGVPGRKIAAVVVDGMHPRTLSRAPTMLQRMEEIRIAVIVSPPLLERELAEFGYPEKARVWLWDPEAQRTVAECISKGVNVCPEITERLVWICDDQEVDEALAEVHDLLGASQREARKDFPPLWSAWSIYHRLRQLAVPLPQLEDSACEAWGAVPIRKRLALLKEEWPQEVAVEARWRGILEGLERVYDLLLKRQEPAKFWGVAERVEDRLNESDSPLRVVVPSEREVALLSIQLGHIVDGWFDAQHGDRVEVVSAKGESRRLAAGEHRETLIVGFRVGSLRHLDLYPFCSTEVLAYPYEADVDEAQQDRMYAFAESHQEDLHRCQFLSTLQFPASNVKEAPISPRPMIVIAGHTENRMRKARSPLLDPTALDLERLAASGMPQDWDEDPTRDAEPTDGIQHDRSSYVEVFFDDGRRVKYVTWQGVDVYSPGTGQIQRLEAVRLQRGMQIVSMVDGVYERLYDRLLEALQEKLSPYYIMTLELWEQAKATALQKHHGNRAELHRQLEQRGLQVDYHAVVALFRQGEFEGLAPQKYSDMRIIADYSGRYPNQAMIKLTFRVIQTERGRRRSAGRALHSLLRAIVQGNGYEQAIASARQLGNQIGEVFAAVQVRQVDRVRIVNAGDHR